VPQHRERLITIGIREDIARQLEFSCQNDLNVLFPKQGDEVNLRSALTGIENDPEEIEVWLDSCRLSASYEQVRALPKGGSKHLKMTDVVMGWRTINADFNLIRAGWHSTCPTLTCRGQQLGISGVHHPDFDRKFTISELKRIMSLPDDFQLSGTLNDKATRIGNMVPPLMTHSIAKSVYDVVLSKVERSPYLEDANG
jgi:site-specific DNA-cytosine methylase